MWIEAVLVVLVCCSSAADLTSEQFQPKTDMNETLPNFTLRKKPTIFLNAETMNAVSYGSCTYADISQASQLCESLFFRHLIKEKCQSCSVLYKSLQQCIRRKWESCGTSPFPKPKSTPSQAAQSNNMLYYSESSYCNDGTLALPGVGNPINYCTPQYDDRAATCIEAFHEIFRKNLSFPETCAEFRRARQCMYGVQDRECNYPPLLQVILEEKRKLYRCWNPFCVWRRDENLEDDCEQTDDQSPTLSYLEQPIRGIPADCDYNKADAVVDLPDIDLVTFHESSEDDPKAFERRRPSPQKYFSPPARSTTPAGGSQRISRCSILIFLTMLLCSQMLRN